MGNFVYVVEKRNSYTERLEFNSVFENQTGAINFCEQELRDILNNWNKERDYEIVCEQEENNTTRIFTKNLFFAPQYVVTKSEVK